MSKTYIVSRNGGTVSKAPVNDNKLPIYANETALDADLANIPDNTLVATKGGHDDVINQMKAYIRNQNVLSDWEDLEIKYTEAQAVQFDFDGVLIASGSCFNYTQCTLHLISNSNTTEISFVGTTDPAYSIWSTGTVPFKKGEKLWCSVGANAQISLIKARYYKLRDYTGR